MHNRDQDRHHMDDDDYDEANAKFFNLMPNPTYEIFRDEITSKRTQDESDKLMEATAGRKPFAELP